MARKALPALGFETDCSSSTVSFSFFWLIKEAKTRPFKRDFAIAEDTSLALYAVIRYLIAEAFQRTV